MNCYTLIDVSLFGSYNLLLIVMTKFLKKKIIVESTGHNKIV